MGNNFMPCLGTLKKVEKHPAKDSIILTPDSPLSNSVIGTKRSSLSFLSINQSVATSLKTEFNWSRIQSIYLGCNSSLDDDINLSLPMVKTVEKLFDVLEKDLINSCKKIYFSTTCLGKQFVNKFEESSSLVESDMHFKKPSDKMLAHVISYLKLHRLVLYAFESNIEEARDVLNLIALSHLLMNITPSDFRLMDIALEKYLLKFKVIDDNTLKMVISYFTLITNYICNFIDQRKNHSLLNDMLCSDSEEMNKRREHLRQLRKWKKLVAKLRHETCIYIEEMLDGKEVIESYSDEESETFKFNSHCPLSSIRTIYNRDIKYS